MAVVDAPALTIDHHHAPAMHDSSATEGHDRLESLGIEACRSILTESSAQDTFDNPMTERLRANGPLSDAMRNVYDKLKTLCKEADEKVDHKERSFMHHHAGTMEELRRQLDAHFYVKK